MRAHIPAIIIDQATGSHPHPWCRALPDTTFSRQVLNYLGMHPQVRLYNYQDLTALRRPIGRPSPAPASSSGVPGREFGEGQRAVLWIEERPRLREWREQRGRAAAGRVRFAERQRYIERLAGRWALAVEGVGQAGKAQGPAKEAVTHRKQPNNAKMSERPEGRTDAVSKGAIGVEIVCSLSYQIDLDLAPVFPFFVPENVVLRNFYYLTPPSCTRGARLLRVWRPLCCMC